jgi:uncharacterized protein (TIGR02611 family)
MSPILKRVLVGIVGGLVTVIGVVALIAPGPGWLIIFAGLGILGTEFAWAARALKTAKGVASRAVDSAKIDKRQQLLIFAVIAFSALALLVIWYGYLR